MLRSLPFYKRCHKPAKYICYLVILLAATINSIASPPFKAGIANGYINLVPTTTALSSSDNPSCFGTTITFTATVDEVAATGMVEFYDGAALIGSSALAGGIATISTSSLSAGTHSLTATYTGDGTYTSSTSPVLVQSIDAATPVAPGTITGLGTVCPATTQTYSVTAVANATVYNWTLPAGWSINSGGGTNSISVTTGTSSGNISVTAGNACGTSAPQTRVLTASPPRPATPGVITGTTTVCPSVTGLVYSIAAVPNATSYMWTLPPGWTATPLSSTTSITVTSGAFSGNMLVAAVNSCGSSSFAQTINLTPDLGTDNTGYTDGTTKSSDGITVAAVTTPVRRGYLKFPTTALSVIPVGATITPVLRLFNNVSGSSAVSNFVRGLGANDPTTATAAAIFNAAGTGTVYHTGSWGTTPSINLTLNPTALTDIQNSISSPGYISMGLQKGSSGAGVSNFWGYSAGASAPVLAVTYASLRSLAITVSPGTPAAPGTISGPSAVCPNAAGNVYSIASVVNASTYTWSVPVGWTITNGQGTISITATAGVTGGDITVTAGNSCGTSAAGPAYAVSIGVLPTVSASPLTQEACSGSPIGTITATNPNAIPGTTYTWTRDNVLNTGMAMTGSTSSTITGTLSNATAIQQTSTFTIYAVSGIGCISASPAVVTVAVNPNPVASAGADQSSCVATPVTIGGFPTASGGTAGYTYLWSAGVSNTTIANPTATPGTYTVTVTDSKNCSASDVVVVNASSGTKTWIGSGSTTGGGPDNNFNNPLNWNPAGVPGVCNDVVINVDIYNIFNLLAGALVIPLSTNITINSLSIDIGGAVAISSASYFKLYTGSNTLNIINNTTLNTHTSSFFAPVVGGYISVGNGGVVIYGGNLTTLRSNNCLNYPIYADVHNTGKMYIKGNASLTGIGNDPSNKPSQVIFDGTATQTVTQNSGTQVIFLGATSTDVGETNSPTVLLAGTGTGGFRTLGNLNINNTSILDLAQQRMIRHTSGGTINMSAGSTMRVGHNTGGVSISNFPANFTSYSFNATSTVEYYASTAQTVIAAPLFGNLLFSNTNTKTITGNTTAQGNITITGSAVLAGGSFITTLGGNWTNYNQSGFSEQASTITFNGTGAQTINTTGGEIFYSLAKNASGTLTQLCDVSLQGGGSSTYTLSAGTHDAGTFSFNSASGIFTITGGLLKLARLATTLPEFSITPYNISGGTIELYGAGDQVLRGARAYRNLTFSTSGLKTVTSAITSITGTILTQHSVTLDVSNSTMGGAGTNLTMTGTSLYKTAGTGTKPDAQGTYTLGTGTTVEFTNIAGTTEDIRLTAPTYYNVIVSGSNVANASLGTGIKFQAGGSFTVKNGGLFKLGNSTGFSGGAATAIANPNNPAITLEDGSTVEYYGGPAGTNAQVITNQMPYYSLNFSGTSVKTAPAGTITVRGNLSNNNSGFNHSNGIVLLNGTVAQNYNSTGTNLVYYDFTATNPVNVNVNGDLSVENVLSLGAAGKLNLTTGYISLKSSLSGTARVDQINQVNSLSYGTGGFIVERYIPTGIGHEKSWQLLSAPAFGQSVNATWQEGNAPLVVGSAGLGTTLSSERPGAVARGYDFYTPAGPSIKTYNSATNNWDGIDDGSTPTASLQLANAKGYMIFVRGDRSVQSSATAANATVLRTKGRLYSPGTDAPPTSPVPANSLQSVGNPYASVIDFPAVLAGSPGIDGKFYVWDPLLAGTYSYGGYQVLSSVTGWIPTPGGTTNYPDGVPYSKIQSGQAFFVYSTPGGAVSFNETNKIPGSQGVFRANDTERQLLRTSLYNQAGALVDGNVAAFDPLFTNEFDGEDAIKINNSAENFGIANNNRLLSVDARSTIAGTDTLFYHFNGLRVQGYRLKITPSGMDLPGLHAYLVDRFANTTTELSLVDTTTINFSITSDALTASPDRFFVVFKAIAPVPEPLVNVTAKRTSGKSIEVKWKVENELNIDMYELERSTDGQNYGKIDNRSSISNNGGTHTYSYEDSDAPGSAVFYRVKVIGAGTDARYSNVVMVDAIGATADGIQVYPNPVAGAVVNIYFRNQQAGNYRLQVSNSLGEILYQESVSIQSNNELVQLPLSRQVGSGVYQLSIIAPGNKKIVKSIIIN